MPASLESGIKSGLRKLKSRVRYQYRNLRLNAASRRQFSSMPPQLDPVQIRVLEGLRGDGLVMISFDELIGKPQLWQQLSDVVTEFVDSPRVQHKVRDYQRNYETAGWKDYLVRLYPPVSEVGSDDPVLRFGVSDRLLAIANSYLELWSKLLYFDVWYTIPVAADRRKVASQRWHRDPDDERMLKVFLYFSDVDAAAGPLEYVKGSNAPGRYYELFRSQGGHYPPEAEFDRLVLASDRIRCTGKQGTFVLCDTRGFHRGGFATDHARILAKWAFVSPASLSPRSYRVEWPTTWSDWPEASAFAVS